MIERVEHLVYMPTNRACGAAIDAVLDECSVLPRDVKARTALLIIDDCSTEIAAANLASVEAAAIPQGIRVWILDRTSWTAILNNMAQQTVWPDDQDGLLLSALVKPGGSYGAGPNKASLIAAGLRCVTVHRRDSDQLPTVDRLHQQSSLRVEISGLTGGFASPQRAPAACVGSSLTGQPTRDRRDLRACGDDLADQLDRLSHLDEQQIRFPRLIITDPPVRISVGGIDAVDDNGRVEMGIAAIHTVHEWIPEMPAVGILGSDYFQKGLLYQLALPVLYHPLTAHHVYEAHRELQGSDTQLAFYAVAELRYAVLRRIWNEFNQNLMAERSSLTPPPGGQLDGGRYADILRGTVSAQRDAVEALPDRFVDVYRTALGRVTDDIELRRRLERRITLLEAHADTAVDYVVASFHEYAALSAAWARIVEAAREVVWADVLRPLSVTSNGAQGLM